MITPPLPATAPFATLAAPPAPPAANDPAQLKAAAQRFEAIFIRQMLSAARASSFGGDEVFGGPGLEQFNAMRDEKLADIASQTGAFGFAKVIEAQLAAQMKTGA